MNHQRIRLLRSHGLLGLCLAFLTAHAACAVEESPWQVLFNGRDLSGWDTYLAKPHSTVKYTGETRTAKGAHAESLGVDKDPTGVFSVVTVDGRPAIRISGEVFGTLTTQESYSNYHLRLEVRWGEKRWEPRLTLPRDGGLLYHANGSWGEAGAWLPSLELQIQEGDMGDFWAVNASATTTARLIKEKDWIYDPASPPKVFRQGGEVRRCIKGSDAEKPWGAWNTIELVCMGDKSWHIVNGRVVMRLEGGSIRVGDTWRTTTSGRLQLQSEGAEYFVRRIELRPIRELPSIAR